MERHLALDLQKTGGQKTGQARYAPIVEDASNSQSDEINDGDQCSEPVIGLLNLDAEDFALDHD